ncbi:hypothetical protein NCER_102464 [Vairimorpha ceranae BRL01]|uniref:Tubby C-terminal domain-containing protein n=2 Tax=Vairimorpha ceranae TaxID=40302 RepID=C4VC23_VAIC1|nr:tubby protein [Vairimorpha ceranae]EEQ81229.1 hypothetical protein NCER_102464 [Vairimorpha ceranae BRL01]KAF5141541.1 hypothetical protein G9O61_00g002800 [Vairimorpha ceranae]KKO74142.1 tubby protein [Vairimorpha ceranae]
MHKDLPINPYQKNILHLDKPIKINYISQGTITVNNKNEYEYKNALSESSLIGIRRMCGFDILQGKESISILKRNLIGSHYYSKDMTITYTTSLFRKKKPRSFIVKIGHLYLVNKEPLYNAENMSYSLNFNGRVTVPSVKNFQLIHPTDKTYIILTFGKVGDNTYVMDYKYPLSAVKAFSICLAALDNKYFCD